MKKTFLTIFIFFLITTPLITSAQAFLDPAGINAQDPTTLTGVILQRILGTLGIIALLLFIYAGFLWMTAQGDATKIQTAQKILVWASIGLLVIFSSYSILSFVFGII